MSHGQRRRVLGRSATILAAALAIAGCGGDGEQVSGLSTTSGTTSTTTSASTGGHGDVGGSGGAGDGGSGGVTSSSSSAVTSTTTATSSTVGSGGAGGSNPQLALAVVVTLPPENIVTAVLDISAPNAVSASVEYGDTTTYGTTTPTYPVPSSGQLRTALLGLLPGADNHARVTATGADGKTVSTSDIVIHTLDLPNPHFFPPFTITADDGTATGYLLTRLKTKDPKGMAMVMLDRKGRVMWYRAGKNTGLPETLNRIPNGNFVLFNPGIRGFDEENIESDLIRLWTVPTSVANGLDGHEFQYLPALDHAYVITNQKHVVDSTIFGGGPGGVAKFGKVLELDGQGSGTLIWDSYGPAQLSDRVLEPNQALDPAKFDLTHMNALEPTPDGMILVSLRNFNAVWKIDPTNGTVLWKLGGVRSDFTFVNDPQGGFTSAHDIRMTPSGHVTLFDNGNGHLPKASRGVEYALDEVAMTATLVEEYDHDPPIYSAIMGSNRMLPNGHVLLTFYKQSVLSEYDAPGHLVWELDAARTSPYRCEWVPTLYP